MDAHTSPPDQTAPPSGEMLKAEVEAITKQVETFAEERGISVLTICAKATGNSYVLRNMKNKMKRARNDIRALQDFMATYDEEQDEDVEDDAA